MIKKKIKIKTNPLNGSFSHTVPLCAPSSHRHDFFFLVREMRVNLPAEIIRQLL